MFKKYVLKRIEERSFWIGVSLAVSAASVLPDPWSYISFVAGVLGSLIPDGNIRKINED